MNFCQIDKYLEKNCSLARLSCNTRNLIKMFQCCPIFYILVVLQGLCGRLENVFDIVSGRYTVTIVVDTLLPGPSIIIHIYHHHHIYMYYIYHLK